MKEGMLGRYTKVRCYGYRSYRPERYVMNVPRSAVKAFEEALARACGVMPDNHCLYEVECNESASNVMVHEGDYHIGRKFVVYFTNFTAVFGIGMVRHEA